MKFRRNAPIILITAIVIVIGGLTILSNRLFSGLTTSVEESRFALMQSIVEDALASAGNKALARAELVASLPTTRRLMETGNRTGLLDEYGEMFAIQKARHGVDQAQFHVPPATSFLRLQSPDKFGDDLTKFRPMVVAANRDKSSKKGFAIAKAGPAIFGIAPIKGDTGDHVGTFEFGIDFGAVLVSLKSAYGLDLALFVEEAPLREFATGMDPAKLSDQNRVGKYIRFSSTNETLMSDLAGPGDIAVVNEPTRLIAYSAGAPYGVLLYPLKNGAGESLGVLAAAQDFSGSRAAAGRSLIWQITAAIFAIVLLSGAVIIVLRGMLLKPMQLIDDQIAALASGEIVSGITDPNGFPEELDNMRALLERVQTRRAPGKLP